MWNPWAALVIASASISTVQAACLTDQQAVKVANNFATLFSNFTPAFANQTLAVDFTDQTDSVSWLMNNGTNCPKTVHRHSIIGPVIKAVELIPHSLDKIPSTLVLSLSPRSQLNPTCRLSWRTSGMIAPTYDRPNDPHYFAHPANNIHQVFVRWFFNVQPQRVQGIAVLRKSR